MRTVLVVAALALAMPREAEACVEIGYVEHHLDSSQLADFVEPGPVSLSMWIEEAATGGCATSDSRCGEPVRRLVVMASASDDRTPPDYLGYRVTITEGSAPFPEPGDVRPIDGLLFFALGDSDFDFELSIRAVDLNGNMGPATYTQVTEASNGGCASHHAGGAMSFGLIALVGFVVGRRRRRA